MIYSIELDVVSPRRLMRRQDGEEVLDILCNSSPSLVPDKWGLYEPIRTTFDPLDYSEVLDQWGDTFLWKCKRPKSIGCLFSAWSAMHSAGDISLQVDSPGADIDGMMRYLESTTTRFNPFFTYMHMAVDRDVPMGHLTRTICCVGPKGDRYSLTVTGHKLRKFIPELYWGTVFGKVYVDLFGRDRLLSAPAYQVREIGECIYLQLSESIFDLDSNYDSVERTKQAVKRHLGCNAFFDPYAPEDHVYNTPELKLEPYPKEPTRRWLPELADEE